MKNIKYIVISFVMLFLQANTWSMVIKVKGMVCAFCAQGVEKNFNKLDVVKSTKVDLDKMEVTLNLKDKGKGKLSEKKIKEVVTDAGFSYVGVKK